MNTAGLFKLWVNDVPKKPAVVTADGDVISFLALAKMAGSMQAEFKASGLKVGDKALVMAMPSISLYASTLALMGLGVSIVFVEPWMPLKNIQQVIKSSQPKLFLTNILGMVWGSRIKEIRDIKTWMSLNKLKRNVGEKDFLLVDVDRQLPGIITFTTGTTGNPKGVVRSQGYMVDQHEVLTTSLHLSDGGCDLTIFANFVLSNLARGATSLLMPSRWSKGNFLRIDALSQRYRPTTTTAGPAFLLAAMKYCKLESLLHLHVGGALTDCWIFEEAFKKWPKAQILHVYGSSEAEPVAVVDAKTAVTNSKNRGYFQTLFLGHPVKEVRINHTVNSAWVSGRHVCPKYVGAAEENQLYKRIDENGVLWHDMGDRIINDHVGLWYQGRSSQGIKDFLLEQQLYTELSSSKSFIKRDSSQKILWLGEQFSEMKNIASRYKDVDKLVKTTIIRDRRHRARIDRSLSTPKKYR